MENMTVSESEIDKSKTWYVGNNRSKNFSISPPVWWWPFYLTTDKDYADMYADYGIYIVTIQDDLNILDFKNNSELNSLKLDRILSEWLKRPDYDLNYSLYELFRLAKDNNIDLTTLDAERRSEWVKYANDFMKRMIADRKFINQKMKFKSRIVEGDEWFLLYMYYLMNEAGFDGFTRLENGQHEILAIFNVKSLDKISASKI